MAFHRQRTFTPHVDKNTVTTPMSWPGCARPPAGLGSLEGGYNRSRLISTAQPELRRGLCGRRLPPMNESQRTKPKDTDRGSLHKSKIIPQKQENAEFSARKWANIRSTQIHDDKINTRENRTSFQNPQEFKRAFPVPRQKKRDKVVSLNEREAASLRRLQGVYANTKERTLRAERIQQTLKALQDRTLHSEMDESLREYQRKMEVDKGNRTELKRVRDSYHKNKKRRSSRSHISLTALESPQVSRHAYGLPEEGKEFEQTQLVHKTEERLQEIWQKAVRRAMAIDKLVKHTRNTNPELHLPKIKVKRTSPSKIQMHQEEGSDKSKSDHTSELVDVAMTELDALSSVGSDFDDDLTDIGEED